MGVLVSPGGARRRVRGLVAALTTLAIWAFPIAVCAQSLEWAVKASFLYKFAPFVEWPASAFPAASSPFNICVFGADPFGGLLDQAAHGQTVAGHPVAVRRIESVQGRSDCQVVFVSRSRQQPPAEVLRALRGLPVLTVTDAREGVDGGIIHFVVQDGRVRFTIDNALARAGGLVLSSKLLALATTPQRGAD